MRSTKLEGIGTVTAMFVGVATAVTCLVVIFATYFATVPQCTTVSTPPTPVVVETALMTPIAAGIQLLVAGPGRRVMGILLALLVTAGCVLTLILFYAAAPVDACLF